MKTLVALPLATMVVGCALLAGGCNSELDKALQQNRNCNDQLKAAMADAAKLRGENQQLKDALAVAQANLDAKNKEIANLESQKGILQKTIDDLNAKLTSLTGRTPEKMPDRIALPRPMHDLLIKLVDKYPDLLEYDPKTGMVRFKADMTFDPGSDDVSERAKEAMAKFVEIVNTPEALAYNIYIVGHTDDIRIAKEETKRRHPTNWYLSVHRSVTVEGVLEKAGLAPQRIGTVGFSEYHPIAPNASGHKGNKVNRRVELWIVPPDRFLTTGAPSRNGTSNVTVPPDTEE